MLVAHMFSYQSHMSTNEVSWESLRRMFMNHELVNILSVTFENM